SDPARGIFILMILLIAIGGALGLFAWRAPTIRGGGLFSPVSREGALVLNNILLALACFTVLLGTLYPLILEAASGGASRVSVGPPYFNLTFAPIMAVLVVALAFGPLMAWKRGNIGTVLRKLIIAAAAAAVTIAAIFIAVPDGPALAPFAMGLAAWLAAGALVEWAARLKLFSAPATESWRRLTGLPRAASGMTVAHLGLAIMIAGITGTSAWRTELITTLAIGETAQIKNYTLALQAVENGKGPNYTFERATYVLTDAQGAVTLFYPERRFFPVAGQTTTEAAIKTTLLGDLYAVLGSAGRTPATANKWTVRFFINPMVPWIWLGALVMVGGGLLSLSDRRHRVGAPRRKQQVAPGASGAPAPAE
ncbi:MAG: cytochrome c-type biogenesis protein CcmF, partial [Alphaproteobacteria bacterium]